MAYAAGSSTALSHPLSPRGMPSVATGHPPQSAAPHAARTPQQPPQLPQQSRPSLNNSFPHARSKSPGRTQTIL